MTAVKAQRIAAAVLAAALSGCFNESAYTPMLFGFAKPGTSAVSGTTVATGTTSVRLAGAFFTPSTVVYWNGQPLATAYDDSSFVEVTLESALTNNPGRAQVTATNEDSFPSKPLTVEIVQWLAYVSDLSPKQASVGADALVMSVKGTSFLPGAQVLWNDSPLQTTFINAGNLTAAVPAPLLAAAGDAFVQVSNPTCPDNLFCQRISPVVVFTIGTSTRATVQTGASDMVWDSTHGRLYASSIPAIGQTSSILSIDPATATRSIAKPTTGATLQLSISDQDRFLYTGGPYAGPPMRYTLPGFTDAIALSTNTVTEIVAAPGLPSTAALLFTNGTGVIDNTVLRTNVSPFIVQHAAWGFDASALYTTARGAVSRSTVDQSGVAYPPTNVGSLPFEDVFYDRVTRRLYATSGWNLDEQGKSHGTFALPYGSGARPCTVAPDGVSGKVFFACAEYSVGLTIRSYDADTSAPIARVMLVPSDPLIDAGGFPGATRIVRWGSNGLAIATDRTLYLYSGPFVH